MTISTPRRAARTVVGSGVAAVALILSSALPASAHVTVDPQTTEAGAYTLLTFAVPHGCHGSATTKVAIDLPGEGIGPVTPSVNPGWDVARVREGGQDDAPIVRVLYTAKTLLPADLRDSFEFSTFILPDAEGTTLAFPVEQTCEEGQTAWDQLPGDGQSVDDLDESAPAFTVSAPGEESVLAEDGSPAKDENPAKEAGSPKDADSPETTGSPGAPESPAAADAGVADGPSTVSVLALIAGLLGLLGLVLGGTALARTRRRQ